ncbi:MAG: HDOD domain-containing protein [Candidatus Electryonea clarkiae]|nr:HDOD domain-containing protein [Candidatus Electryonea clarkiae]MDP8285638.1 HDOD domain-containing protein [Candidatus Electryonea clarkiae]
MTNKERKARYYNKLKKDADLYSYAPIALRIREVANNPNASAADLANVILHDHGLTTKILKLANSAYYPPYNRRISTLTHAVVIMGFHTIKTLALSVSLYERFQKSDDGDSMMRTFWIHSVATALCSNQIAQMLKYKSGEEAFVAGFLHDIGKLLISFFTPVEWDAISMKIEMGYTSMQAELQQLGTYHTEVGEYVGTEWNLPENLLAVMRNHHRIGVRETKKSTEPLVDIVYIANLIAHRVFHEKGASVCSLKDLKRQAKYLLNLSSEQVNKLIDFVKQNTTNTAEELSIPIFSLNDVGESQEDASVEDETTLKEITALKNFIQRKNVEKRLMFELSESFRQSTKISEIYTAFTEGFFRNRLFDVVILFRVNRRVEYLEGVLAYGVESQEEIRNYRFKLSSKNNVFATVVEENRTELVVDVTQPAYVDTIDKSFVDSLNITSFACVPVVVWGKVESLLMVSYYNEDSVINDDMIEMVHLIAMQAGSALERLIPNKRLIE